VKVEGFYARLVTRTIHREKNEKNLRTSLLFSFLSLLIGLSLWVEATGRSRVL